MYFARIKYCHECLYGYIVDASASAVAALNYEERNMMMVASGGIQAY